MNHQVFHHQVPSLRGNRPLAQHLHGEPVNMTGSNCPNLVWEKPQLLMVYTYKKMQCWLEIQLLANLFCGVSRAFLKHQMVDVATISKAHCTRKHCPNCIGSRKRKQTSTVQSLFKLLRNSTVHIFCAVIYIYNISSSSSSSPSKSPLKPHQNTCFTCRLERYIYIYTYCKIDNTS